MRAIIRLRFDFQAGARACAALQSLDSAATGKLSAWDAFVFVRTAMPFGVLQDGQHFRLQISLLWLVHRLFLFAFASKPRSNSSVVMPKPFATLTMAVSDGLRTPRSSPEI